MKGLITALGGVVSGFQEALDRNLEEVVRQHMELAWRECGGGEPEQEAVARAEVEEKEGEAEGEGANIQKPAEEQSREGKSREVEGVQVPA